MKKITELSGINYEQPEACSFEGTVVEILHEGDGEKRPIKYSVRLEESGEIAVINSWKYGNLQTIKELLKTDDVAEFEFMPTIYGNFGQQLRGGNLRVTGKKSQRKIIRTNAPNGTKEEIACLVQTYIPKGILRTYIEELILNNEKFFKWPAASRIHHNYPGGLALHSLNVCKQALSLSETYTNENVKLSVLVAGSLLHDIGKLEEYTEDGGRTTIGNLLGHHAIGYGKIVEIANKIGIDPIKNIETSMLLHIILSHHGKLEFGSPVVPGIMEAVLVSTADELDAKVESLNTTLYGMMPGEFSSNLTSLHGGKIFKWN